MPGLKTLPHEAYTKPCNSDSSYDTYSEKRTHNEILRFADSHCVALLTVFPLVSYSCSKCKSELKPDHANSHQVHQLRNDDVEVSKEQGGLSVKQQETSSDHRITMFFPER